MHTRIIGDTHGNYEEYKRIAEHALLFGNCDSTTQLGDFGVGFYPPFWSDREWPC